MPPFGGLKPTSFRPALIDDGANWASFAQHSLFMPRSWTEDIFLQSTNNSQIISTPLVEGDLQASNFFLSKCHPVHAVHAVRRISLISCFFSRFFVLLSHRPISRSPPALSLSLSLSLSLPLRLTKTGISEMSANWDDIWFLTALPSCSADPFRLPL